MFMNSENSKTSQQHQFLLNFTDKTDLQRDEEIAVLKYLLHMEKYKKVIKTIYFQFQLQNETINSKQLMDHILCQIFKIKIKNGDCLDFLSPKTILFGITENKINKDKNK